MLMLEKIVIVVLIIELIVFFHIDREIKRDEEIKANEKQSEIIIPHKEEVAPTVEEPIKEEIQEGEVPKKPELSEEEKRQRAEERKRREEKRLQEEIDDVCPHANGIYDAEGILEEFDGDYFECYEEVVDFVEQYCKIE